jgi:hypothetical protein
MKIFFGPPSMFWEPALGLQLMGHSAFLSAIYGDIDALDALVRGGADVHFVTEGDR